MSEADGAAAQWADRTWTSSDGLHLYYRDYSGPSDRPPILCLHGLTRNSRDFSDFAARYAGEWRVIVPDFRGRGRSDRDPQSERYAPSVYAADILKLLDELQLPCAIFVGTSLGGLVTMLIATIAPQRVAATVLNDVGPELDRPGLERIASYVGQPNLFGSWEEAAAALAARHAAVFPRYREGDWERFAHRVTHEVEGGVAFDYDMTIADNFRRALAAPPTDAWPYFQALAGAPLLILRAEFSDLLSTATAQAMVDAHPGAELVTVPGVGHAPELNEPEAVTAIGRLLDRMGNRERRKLGDEKA